MTPQAMLEKFGPREAMEYDVLVVGAGPGGLATAIRIKQQAAAQGKDVSVVVLEKGSEPGAHILSGAPSSFQFGNSSVSATGSITAPLRMCAPGSEPFSSTTTDTSLP